MTMGVHNSDNRVNNGVNRSYNSINGVHDIVAQYLIMENGPLRNGARVSSISTVPCSCVPSNGQSVLRQTKDGTGERKIL